MFVARSIVCWLISTIRFLFVDVEFSFEFSRCWQRYFLVKLLLLIRNFLALILIIYFWLHHIDKKFSRYQYCETWNRIVFLSWFCIFCLSECGLKFKHFLLMDEIDFYRCIRVQILWSRSKSYSSWTMLLGLLPSYICGCDWNAIQTTQRWKCPLMLSCSGVSTCLRKGKYIMHPLKMIILEGTRWPFFIYQLWHGTTIKINYIIDLFYIYYYSTILKNWHNGNALFPINWKFYMYF